MGVPAFFKWLTLRYPKVAIDVDNNSISNKNNNNYAHRYINNTLSNLPNFTNEIPEVDNLYLDMNGIIHPCCHPVDRPTPDTLAGMFNDVFEYVDRIVEITKPKSLIYLAIDGVAPRAKMNQQRSRRFSTALEASEKLIKKSELKKEWNKKGINKLIKEKLLKESNLSIENKTDFNNSDIDSEDNNKSNKSEDKFDNNCITPGTEFMELLSYALNLFITHRLQYDFRWKNKSIIFSSANVPGEGEHKILEYIRKQRTLKDYNPNTSHCIYGADADLIMLSLITHEPNFIIIRESLDDSLYRKCEGCGKVGHRKDDCPVLTGRKELIKSIKDIGFSIIKIGVLREYLSLEFCDIYNKDTGFIESKKIELNGNIIETKRFEFSLEKVIDDFIFLCFFVGNDFLPHLPTFKIREGGIDALLLLYKHILPELEGYIAKNGKLNLYRVEILLKKLAKLEDEFLKNIRKLDDENKERILKRNKYNNEKDFASYQAFKTLEQLNFNNNNNNNNNTDNKEDINKINENKKDLNINLNEDNIIEHVKEFVNNTYNQDLETKNIINKSKLLNNTNNQKQLNNNSNLNYNNIGNSSFDKDKKSKDKFITELINNPEKKFEEVLAEKIRSERRDIETNYKDPVRLGETGYRERYYLDKFKVSCNDEEFLSLIKKNYIEGLCWVFEYYYNGCPSWDWHYCFHYAPFISDLTSISELKIHFELDSPLSPFMQLLAVLPAASNKILPKCFRQYMLDPYSEIADLYPLNFKLDINGQPYAWMGVNLIPFMEPSRIKKIVNREHNKLTDKEILRNSNSFNFRVYTSWDNYNHIIKENKLNCFNGYRLVEDKCSVIRNSTIENKENKLHDLVISKIKNCNISSFLAEELSNNEFNTLKQLHTSELKSGVICPRKEVYEDNLDYYSKRIFKGDFAIELVKNKFCISDKYSSLSLHNKQFDRKYNNNNRGIAYNPEEINFIGKKRYQDSLKSRYNSTQNLNPNYNMLNNNIYNYQDNNKIPINIQQMQYMHQLNKNYNYINTNNSNVNFSNNNNYINNNAKNNNNNNNNISNHNNEFEDMFNKQNSEWQRKPKSK